MKPWPPLNSTFGHGDAAAQQPAGAAGAAWRAFRAGAFEVWVTHQVNITAFTGESAAMGEAVAVDARAR